MAVGIGRLARRICPALLAVTSCGDAEPPASASARAEPPSIAPAVVGAGASSSEDDFIVHVGNRQKTGDGCGAALLAPNLIVTSKHCLFPYEAHADSTCDATGEPAVGSQGGYVTGTYLSGDLLVHTGVSARSHFRKGEPAQATIQQIFHDGTPTLCSHDLAFATLDRPLAAPLGRLRLGARPTVGERFSLAGYGAVEERLVPATRRRRDGLEVHRVGPPRPAADPVGSLSPRTFESGQGGCNNDSGAPAFDPDSKAVLGVLARGALFDPAHPSSPCLGATAFTIYMTVNDFPTELRRAFAAAGAEPWLTGRAAPGFVPFGEPCTGDLECKSELCAIAPGAASGVCSSACSDAVACPGSATCTGGLCRVAEGPASPVAPASAGSSAPDRGGFQAGGGGACTASPIHDSPDVPAVAGAAFVALVVRRRKREERNRRPR